MTTRQRNIAIAIAVAILILIGLGAVGASRGWFDGNTQTTENGTGATTTPGTTTSTSPTSTPPTDGTPPTSTTPGQTGKENLIRVRTPQPNSTVRSPLRIEGEARGTWYFEASFPVRIIDANGRQLGIGHAEAQGEWMTENFVPFIANLTFSAPSTETGTLILEKDNPSGLPEHADELRIPVRFETQEREIQVYYYNASRDRDASGNQLCSAQGLVAVERNVSRTNTPIQDAIRELIKGNLTAQERAQGLSTEFPLAGFELRGATLGNDGTLTLEFADPQNKTSGGSCRVSVLRHQIEATAKQFPEVKSVRIIPATLFQP